MRHVARAQAGAGRVSKQAKFTLHMRGRAAETLAAQLADKSFDVAKSAVLPAPFAINILNISLKFGAPDSTGSAQRSIASYCTNPAVVGARTTPAAAACPQSAARSSAIRSAAENPAPLTQKLPPATDARFSWRQDYSPEEIDAAVLAELPADVQREVRSQMQSMGAAKKQRAATIDQYFR